MDFTRNEKLAILQALDLIVLADGRIDRMEGAFMGFIIDDFGLFENALGEARQLDPIKTGLTLKAMSYPKKEIFKEMAFGMADIDGETHAEERKMISLLFSMMN